MWGGGRWGGGKLPLVSRLLFEELVADISGAVIVRLPRPETLTGGSQRGNEY